MKTIESFNKTAKIMEESKSTGFTMFLKNAKTNQDFYKSDEYSKKLAEWKEFKIKKADLETIKDTIQGGNGSRNKDACVAELEKRRDEAIRESDSDAKNKVISLSTHTQHKSALEQQCENRKSLLEEKIIDIPNRGREKVVAELESEIANCQNEIERLDKEKEDLNQENRDKYREMSDEEIITEVTKQTIQNEIKDIQEEVEIEKNRIQEIMQKAKTYLKWDGTDFVNTNEAEYNKLRDEHNNLVNNIKALEGRKKEYQQFLNEIDLSKIKFAEDVKTSNSKATENETKNYDLQDFLNPKQNTNNNSYNYDAPNNKKEEIDENNIDLDEFLGKKTKEAKKTEDVKETATKEEVEPNIAEQKNISVRIVKGEDGVNKFVYGQIDEKGKFVSASTYNEVFKDGEYGEFTTNQYDTLLKGYIDRGYQCNDNKIIVFGDSAKKLDPLLLTYLDMNGMENEAKVYAEAILNGDMTEFNKLVNIDYDLADIKGLKYGEKLICKELAQKAKECELNVKEPQTFLKKVIEKLKGVFKKPKLMLDAPKNVKNVINESVHDAQNSDENKKQFTENLKVQDEKLTPEFTIDSMDKEFEKYQPAEDKDGNRIIVNEQKDKDGNVIVRRSIRGDSEAAKRFFKKWDFGLLWEEALLELDGKIDPNSEVKEGEELKSKFRSDQSKSLYSYFIHNLRRQMMQSDSIDLNQIVDSIQKGENETLNPDKVLAKLLGSPENVKTVMEFAKLTVPENKIKADMTKVEEYKKIGEGRRKSMTYTTHNDKQNENKQVENEIA